MEKEELKKQFKTRIYQYVLRLIKFLVRLPNDPVLKEMKSQLTRSGTSVGANYQNFFLISLKSANESKFWLSVLKNTGLVPNNLGNESCWLLQETGELANIFASSILTMKGKTRCF